MRRSALEDARILLRRRKFSRVVDLLEYKESEYKENFNYYLVLGTACLYLGDPGSAESYLNRARRFTLKNSQMLLGQAAIYLRRGDTARAIDYYYQVLENAPDNKTALDALEFIKLSGDYDTICEWVDSGRIERFYPPLGVNPDKVFASVFAGIFAAVLVSVAALCLIRLSQRPSGMRSVQAGIPEAAAELSMPFASSEPAVNPSHAMGEVQMREAYDRALKFFDENRDNAARLELNRILLANPTEVVRSRALSVVEMLKTPSIDSIKDNFSVREVVSDVELYKGCYVVWAGAISTPRKSGGKFGCDLLVGEDLKHVDGISSLSFESEPVPPLDEDKPLRVLGEVLGLNESKVSLLVLSWYQSPNGVLPPLR